MIELREKITIHDDYSLIRNKKYNEQIVLSIINDSKIVFPEKYIHIEKQDNGECDFINIDGTKKYDLTLLFDNEICQCLSKSEILSFYNKTENMLILNDIKDLKNLENHKLFIEMKSRLDKLKDDEDRILFFPFPILATDFSLAFASDIFNHCYRKLKTKKKLYLICLDKINNIVIRDLSQGINSFE